jgi:hypothetical protein
MGYLREATMARLDSEAIGQAEQMYWQSLC